MAIIRIWTFSLLTFIIAYPYPPTTNPSDGPFPPTLAYGSALLLTMRTPATSFQSDKVGTYVISGETINGAPVWRHAASGNKLYADACKLCLNYTFSFNLLWRGKLEVWSHSQLGRDFFS